jgi:hypothetical protein
MEQAPESPDDRTNDDEPYPVHGRLVFRLANARNLEALAERCSSLGCDGRFEARTQGVPVLNKYGRD